MHLCPFSPCCFACLLGNLLSCLSNHKKSNCDKLDMLKMKVTIKKKSKHSPNIASSCSCNIMAFLVCCNLLCLCCGIEKTRKTKFSCNFSGIFGYFRVFLLFFPGCSATPGARTEAESSQSFFLLSIFCNIKARTVPTLSSYGWCLFCGCSENFMCDHVMRGQSMGFFMHSCFTILIVTTEDWPLDEGPLLLKRPMCGHSM